MGHSDTENITGKETVKAAFQKGKAFIPYIMAGFPDEETTIKLIYALERAGADLIELGIPFSDPTAEGPVIQEASKHALKNGMNTDRAFDLLLKVREQSNIPIAIMTYINPIFSYGTEDFVSRAKACGVCALIVPDVPFEEREELKPFCDDKGLALISLIAPSSKERTAMIAKESDGFIYLVSSLGVTGVRNKITTDIQEMTKSVRAASDTPCAVGFGISNPEQAKDIARTADGVIIGSAIVRITIEKGADCVPDVEEFARSVKESIISIKE